MIARMAATARTIPKTYASLAGSGFGAMCPLLAPDRMSPCRTLEGLNGKMCELLHTSALVQKMQGDLSRARLRVFDAHRPLPASGCLSMAAERKLPPSPPAEKATDRQDQAGKGRTGQVSCPCPLQAF